MKYIHDYDTISYRSQDIEYNREMNVREEIKILLMKRKTTITALAEKMKEKTGKNYTQSLLSHKINDESLKYSEMKLICDILDYKIQIFDRKAAIEK